MIAQEIFEKFSRLMPLWVVVLGVAGFFYPKGFMLLTPYLDLMFFFTMIGIGAVLNFSDFRPILKKPYTVGLGLAAQFLIMPALGFAIGELLNLSVTLKLGLILVGCVPGAMASNVIAYLAKTDVAYSIAITSTATLLSPLLTPALLYLYAHTMLDIQFFKMFLTIIKIVIAPLFIGFLLRHFFERQINRFSYVSPAFSTLFVALICAMVVAMNRDYFLGLTVMVFMAVSMQNLFGMIFGYGAAMLYGFDTKRRRTLAIEVGMQNAGLGALLALKHFGPQAALIPAAFATWCVITASILAEIWSREGRNSIPSVHPQSYQHLKNIRERF
jgi:BASS family bile acid:Na+ symporter